MRNGLRKRVLIIQGQIKQYRVPFFDKLHAALQAHGITLRVGYSDPPLSERAKRDNCDLPPEYGVKVKGYWSLGNRAVWQPLLREVVAADLVIVEQANKYIINHILLPCSALGMKKVAYWGHGRNRQSLGVGLSEWLKTHTLHNVDWWFAYTAGTAAYLAERGVPLSKITNVQNSVDTHNFREQLAVISNRELAEAREELGIAAGSKVGLFCGGVTSEKMPRFLVQAVAEVKARIVDFEFLAIGSGPEKAWFERASAEYPWFHYLGPQFGRRKALYFKMADAFLMPGLVGLAILDAFCAGIPIITTDFHFHSPEIEYLQQGRNGIRTRCNVEAYAQQVVHVMGSPGLLLELREGALRSSDEYSIERMVRNFAGGVLDCLETGR
jgi:glycosyltransferase involved in cell wall biosynthesis